MLYFIILKYKFDRTRIWSLDPHNYLPAQEAEKSVATKTNGKWKEDNSPSEIVYE